MIFIKRTAEIKKRKVIVEYGDKRLVDIMKEIIKGKLQEE